MGSESGIKIVGREFAVEDGEGVGDDERFKVRKEFDEEGAFDVREGFEVGEEFELRHTLWLSFAGTGGGRAGFRGTAR